MNDILNLNRITFDKNDYPKVIDTEFSQLITPNLISIPNIPTVDEFFELYDSLFFEIPIDGDVNSHKELIKRSTEYVGETQNTEEIDLLLEEINQLRLELLEARQLIDDLTQ